MSLFAGSVLMILWCAVVVLTILLSAEARTTTTGVSQRRSVAWTEITTSGRDPMANNILSCRGGDSSTVRYNRSSRIVENIPFVGPLLSGQSAVKIYRRTLQDQVSLLERQLRQSRDELALLRRQLRHRTAGVVPRSEISNLMKEISKLENMKLDLENMLATEQSKIEELEEMLRQARDESDAKEQRYLKELEQIQTRLDAKAQQQRQELKTMMEQRLEEAVKKAQEETRKQMENKIEQITKRLQDNADKELNEERRRSQQAVEREKIKMRKLVKALAEREKKLIAASTEKERRAKEPSKLAKSATARKSTAAGTVRGPRV